MGPDAPGDPDSGAARASVRCVAFGRASRRSLAPRSPVASRAPPPTWGPRGAGVASACPPRPAEGVGAAVRVPTPGLGAHRGANRPHLRGVFETTVRPRWGSARGPHPRTEAAPPQPAAALQDPVRTQRVSNLGLAGARCDVPVGCGRRDSTRLSVIPRSPQVQRPLSPCTRPQRPRPHSPSWALSSARPAAGASPAPTPSPHPCPRPLATAHLCRVFTGLILGFVYLFVPSRRRRM